jgi:hypothetical protein
VHIDSDVFETNEVGEAYRLNLQGLTAEVKADKIKELLVSKIESNFYQIASPRIIFAIAIEAIECWFLPIYFSNQKAKAAKYVNCLSTLNPALNSKHGFTIHAKDPNQHRQISKPFLNSRDLEKYSSQNPSFKLFVDELKAKVVV